MIRQLPFGALLMLLAVSPLQAEQPNLLFIIADDCTYLDLECYGGQARTPNLNRLCQQGLKFNRCFQAAPMCSPTRHCLYTGLYPVSSGAYPNHTFVKAGTKSVAHYLAEAGYRVALSGKRHINPPESFPFEYSGKNNPDFESLDRLMSECRESQQPFCIFACSNEPHTPWNKGDAAAYPPAKLELPEYFVDTPSTREAYSRYLAEITYYDWQVGECLKLLEKNGVTDNTLVMVVSEQGNSFPFAKWTCFEMGLASAMIVRWPGKVAAATQTDALVEYVDVVPTFLAAAGAAIPKSLEGRSFLPVLLGQSDRHKQYVFGLQTSRGIINGPERYGIRSVRSDRYRYVLNVDADTTFSNAVTKKTNKWWQSWVAKAEAGDAHAADMVARYLQRPREQLYDANADPLNLHNLADDPKLADVKQRLKKELSDWMTAQGDEGTPTELAAEEHQWRNRRKKRK